MLENLYTIIEQNQKFIFIKPNKGKRLDDFIDYSIPIVQQQQKIQEYINSLHNQEYVVIQSETYNTFKKRIDVIKNEQEIARKRQYTKTLKIFVFDCGEDEQKLVSVWKKSGLLQCVEQKYQKVLAWLLYKTAKDVIKQIDDEQPLTMANASAYDFVSTQPIEIPEVEFNLTQQTIVADTRRLREQWNQELVDDLEAYYSPQVEEAITAQLGETIANEVDQEILNELRFGNWYAPAGRNIDGGQAARDWMHPRETTERPALTLNNIENEEQFEEYMNIYSTPQRLYPFRTYQEWQQWHNAPARPINIEQLTPRRGMFQRYARNRVREDFYGTIQVPNDEEVLQQHRTIEVYPERPAEQIRVDFNIFDQQQHQPNQIELTLRYDEAVLRDLEEHYIVDPIDAGLHPIDNIDTEIA